MLQLLTDSYYEVKLGMIEPSRTAIEPSIPVWVERILAAGHLSRQDHFQLVSLALSELATTATDRQAINRVLDDVQSGRLSFHD